jgi:hypothetical protein
MRDLIEIAPERKFPPEIDVDQIDPIKWVAVTFAVSIPHARVVVEHSGLGARH